MPICSHCGKEVSEGIKFCPECGERLKKEFTPEETEKYIQELETSVKEEKPAEKPKTTKKNKVIISIVIAAIIVVSYIGLCTSGTPTAKVAAMSFLEDITGYNFGAVDLSYTKVATGPSTLADLKAGEYSWCVEGTVQHIETKTRYTVQIYVDELQNSYWRKVSIYMAQGVNVPAMQLTQMYP